MSTEVQPGLALLTDLYQLTMAYGYWKSGRGDRNAVFHLFFRQPPFQGGYAVTAGLQTAIEFLRQFRFEPSDIDYLGSLNGNDNRSLFDASFLHELSKMRFSCEVDAMPEGTVAFGNQPILRLTGPIIQCQLVESALLNIINFQTLIATKAARVCQAAGDDSVLEFGLRRAQGIDGGLSASRAAFIGGCSATSNVLAGKKYGIPVRGTHAHSWVMSFDTEQQAFETYAEVMPNNCVFLVDTYDTIEGVHRAVSIGKQLRKTNHEMIGIRLDSGDLAYLSSQARKILDANGFEKSLIIASNDLNETLIESLKTQGARISVWGVGTQLATAYDQPALGGVYKLGAIQDGNGDWHPKIKISEQAAKTTIPGKLQVRRFLNQQGFDADMIFDEHAAAPPCDEMVDLKDATRFRRIPCGTSYRDLLIPVFRDGQPITELESLERIRERVVSELDHLHLGIKRFLNPHEYPVGIEVKLAERRTTMISEARRRNRAPSDLAGNKQPR